MPFSPPPSGGQSWRTPGQTGYMAGCALLLVLVGVVAIYALSQAQELFEWTMRRVETKILHHVSAEVPMEVRREFGEALDRLIDGVAAGRIEPQQLIQVQRRLVEVSKKPRGEVKEDDLRALTVALDDAVVGELEMRLEPSVGRAGGGRAEVDE